MVEQSQLANHIGKPIVLGVRPENLAHGGYTQPGAKTSTLPMQVKLIEMMGDHQYVYLSVPGTESVMTMKCNSHHRCKVGEQIQVHIDTALAHCFESMDDHAKNLTLPAGFQQQQ